MSQNDAHGITHLLIASLNVWLLKIMKILNNKSNKVRATLIIENPTSPGKLVSMGIIRIQDNLKESLYYCNFRCEKHF